MILNADFISGHRASRALGAVLMVCASAVMVACSQGDEGVHARVPRRITFEVPVVSVPTRSGEQIHTSGPFPTNWDFSVAAYKHTGDFTSMESASVYFEPMEATYSAEDKAWSVNADWPSGANDKLTFQAFCPSSWNAGVGVNGVYCGSYTFKTDGSQRDFLYSDRRTNQRGDQDAALWSHYLPSGADAVQLTFHHALASLKFQVRRLEVYAGWTFTIKSITLVGMKVKASGFDQGMAVNATNVSNPVWTPATGVGILGDYANILKNPEVGFPVDYNPVAPNNFYPMDPAVKDLLVMPQTLGPEAQLVVDYEIRSVPAAGDPTPPKLYRQTHKARLNNLIFASGEHVDDPCPAFEPGKQYTFSLEISRTKIRFQPVASGVWNGIHITDMDNEGRRY